MRIPAADAFFLHVEDPGVPQVVGGIVMLDTGAARGDRLPDADQVRALVAARLPRIPQFRRLLVPATWWRRPRWRPAQYVDLRYHVATTRVPDGSGRRGLERLVAELASRPLDLQRPPWRLWLVRGVGAREAAVVALVHHAVGDGIGVVSLLRHLLDPSI